jgi:hypothetical protein
VEDGHRFASWSRVGILKEIVGDRRSGDEVSWSLGSGERRGGYEGRGFAGEGGEEGEGGE